VDVETEDTQFVGGHKTARLMELLLILAESVAWGEAVLVSGSTTRPVRPLPPRTADTECSSE